MGRATAATSDNADNSGISIHALRGEGDINYCVYHNRIYISIHALRGEGDHPLINQILPFLAFQSTPSVGRATQPLKTICSVDSISIHALRGEGDKVAAAATGAMAAFQSTPSVGRAT